MSLLQSNMASNHMRWRSEAWNALCLLPLHLDSFKPIIIFKYLGESRLFSIIHQASNKLLVRIKGSALKWCLFWPLVAFQTCISKYLESKEEPYVLWCRYHKAGLWAEEHLQIHDQISCATRNNNAVKRKQSSRWTDQLQSSELRKGVSEASFPGLKVTGINEK